MELSPRAEQWNHTQYTSAVKPTFVQENPDFCEILHFFNKSGCIFTDFLAVVIGKF